MGTIHLHGMEFFAHHGCFEEERTIGTYFGVDVDLETNLAKAAHSDHLSDTVNYQELYNVVKKEMQIPSNLLEHVAQRILQALYKATKNIDRATVTVRKLNPPLGGKVDYAAVTLSQ
jgi:dihydroneopterin aldolase